MQKVKNPGGAKMDIKYKRQLLSMGLKLDQILDRFMGNEELYEKFLVKFLEDTNFIELKNNLEEKKYEDAFVNAHTLKGVCANLGLDCLSESLIPVVEVLRENCYPEEGEVFKELEENYLELCEIIRENTKDT